MSETSTPRPRVLIAWNQVEDDIYERWQREGPAPLPWDPERRAVEVRSVRQEMEELIQAIETEGYEVICLNPRDDLDQLVSGLRLYRPDVVFNLVEYFHDDETKEAGIVALYELLGIPYTGSSGYALSLCQHKHHTKLLLEGAGLPTAPCFVVENLDAPMPDPEALESRFPYIVKPALEDASGGIEAESVVTTYPDLLARVNHVLHHFEQPALVEEYIEGREIHIGILGNQDPEVLPLFEMLFDDSEFNPDGEWRPHIISYSGKWDPLSQDFYTLAPVCPAEDIDPDTEKLLGAMALRAYRTTGCRDYARIDMRIAESGIPYILEVNPNPDLTNGGAFITCAQASGRTYAETLHEIIELARMRHATVAAAEADLVDGHGHQAPSDHLNRKYWRSQDPDPS